jgi:hypothetical protein
VNAAWRSFRYWPLFLLFVDSAFAGPIGPDNYDFARFGRPVSWSRDGNFNGWTPTTADVNGDQRADLVLYAQDAGGWRTWVALSNGDGTFGVGVQWSASGNWLGSTMLAADVNGDDQADLIALSPRTDVLQVSVALSNGSGTFQPLASQNIPGDYTGWTTAFGDVNGDARPDLIVQAATASGWLTHVALNSGGGTFRTAIAWSASGDFRGSHAGLGDFNGDGLTDIALENNGRDAWRSWVALALGDGKFTAPAEWAVTGDFGAWTSARADFSGDGLTDLQLWAYDADGWHSLIAKSDGTGSFAAPASWTTEQFGKFSAFTYGDFNGDGAIDMVAQRADAKGWQAHVAISVGDGTFLAPKPWADFERTFDGSALLAADVSGDGRTDIGAYATDASGWRAWSALSRPCDTVIDNQDFAARIAGLPSHPGDQIICFKPGLYAGEILVANKRDLTFVAPHGDVTIESTSYAYTPDAAEGVDPGATIQIYQSESVEFDGLTIMNRFSYQKTPEEHKVSRAIEVFRSHNITLSHTHLVSTGKQTINVYRTDGLSIAGALVECYYFCVDATFSSVHASASHFRMNHLAIPDDDHAIFWTDDSDQSYVNSTMEFMTGKGVFAGANNFNENLLEVAGETIVTPNAEGWLSQHPNYNGLNLLLRGTYPELGDWYLMGNVGWPKNGQVCHEPDVGWTRCVYSGGLPFVFLKDSQTGTSKIEVCRPGSEHFGIRALLDSFR